MKPRPFDRARYAAEIRKPGPVKRLTPGEIAALEHRRNLERYLTRRVPGSGRTDR